MCWSVWGGKAGAVCEWKRWVHWRSDSSEIGVIDMEGSVFLSNAESHHLAIMLLLLFVKLHQ